MQITSRVLRLIAASIAISAATTNASADMMMPSDSQTIIQNAVPQTVINDAVNQGVTTAVSHVATHSLMQTVPSDVLRSAPSGVPTPPTFPTVETTPTVGTSQTTTITSGGTSGAVSTATAPVATSQTTSIIVNRTETSGPIPAPLAPYTNIPRAGGLAPTLPPSLSGMASGGAGMGSGGGTGIGSVSPGSVALGAGSVGTGVMSPTPTGGPAASMMTATLVDGRPLPGWLSFDPGTGKFSGTPPRDADPVVNIRIVTRDSDGREGARTVTLFTSDFLKSSPSARPDYPSARPD